MKMMYTPLVLICSFYLLPLKAQLLNENFNAGFPNNWTQNPAATWSLNSVLNSPGNCMITNEPGASSNTTSIISPSLNLAAMIDFTISFKAAVTKNNFVAPEINLSFDNGTTTQFLANWSSGFNPSATYTINEGFETQDSIGTEDVIWQMCTHTLSTLNSTAGRFIFTSQIVNGGWTLFDDIVISGKPVNTNTVTTALAENESESSLHVFPNPSQSQKLTVEAHGIKSVSVKDQLGKEMSIDYSIIDTNKTEIDFKDAAKGIYYLTVSLDNNTSLNKKIVLE